MNTYEIVGLLAAILTISTALPTALKGIVYKQVDELSLRLLTLQLASYLLWLIYGIWISSPPLAVTNIITFTITGIIMVIKLRRSN